MKRLIKLRELIPLGYFIVIIIFSYTLCVLIWDGDARNVISKYSQKYVINNNTPQNVVDSLVCLSKTDMSYTKFINPIPKEGDMYDVVRCYSEKTESWTIQFYLKKYDIEFIFIINGKGSNSIELRSFESETKKELIYKNISYCESLSIQKIFETEILNKVCEYDKCTLLGIATWYSHFFDAHEFLFIWGNLVLVFMSVIYTLYKAQKWNKLIASISIFLFASSFFFPIATAFTDYNLHQYNTVYFIKVIPLPWFKDTFSSILLITSILYFVSRYYYFRANKNIVFFVLILVILSLAIYLPISKDSIDSRFFTVYYPYSPSADFSIGYYFWLASFVVLFVGMIITRKIKNKE